MKNNKTAIAFSAVLLLVFAVCAYFAITDVNKYSEALLHIKVYKQGGAIEHIMYFFSMLGDTLRVVLICTVFLLIPKFNVKCGIPAVLSVIVSALLNKIVKILIARPRPALHAAVLTDASGTSFPSGHAMNSMALYLAAAMCICIFAGVKAKKLKIISVITALLLSLIIGFSRIYFGAHYPTDIIAGWALGTLCAFWVPVWYYSCVYPALVRQFSKRAEGESGL